MNSLFQFDDEPTAPTLKTFVEAGDLAGAANFVETLQIDAAIEAVLRAGFHVFGGKRDKKLFYECLGKQLTKACQKKILPINEPDGTLLF